MFTPRQNSKPPSARQSTLRSSLRESSIPLSNNITPLMNFTASSTPTSTSLAGSPFLTATPSARFTKLRSETPKLSAKRSNNYTPLHGMITPNRPNQSTPNKVMTPGAAQALDLLKTHNEETMHNIPIFCKTKAYMATFLSPFPAQLQSFIGERDPLLNPITSTIDYKSGYVVVASNDSCYYWHPQRIHHSLGPLSKQIPLPTTLNTNKLPLLQVTIPASEDPMFSGLLTCSPCGHLRFFQNLANDSENCYLDLEIPQCQDDYIISLISAHPCGYIVATAKNSMFKVSIYGPNGEYALSYLPISEGVSVFQSLGFFYESSQKSKHISLVAGLKPEGKLSREVLVLNESGIEKWLVSKSSADKKLGSWNIITILSESINRDLDDSNRVKPDIQLVDIQYGKNQQCFVLVSFSTDQNVLYHVVALLDISSERSISIIDKRQLDHKINKSFDKVSISVPNGGPIIFVTFSDCVIMTTIHKGCNFESKLSLKDPINNRIIGSCVDYSQLNLSQYENEHEIVILTNETGLIKINTSFNELKAIPYDPENGVCSISFVYKDYQTDQMYQNMMQSILFASQNILNPFSFQITNLSGDLNAACLAISTLFLEEKSHQAADLKIQLCEKFQRLDEIIYYLVENGLLDNVNEIVRTQLCYNSSKALAGLHLWLYQTSFLSENLDSKFDILSSTFSRINSGSEIFQVRTFFQCHIHELENFIKQIDVTIQRDDPALFIFFTNQIVCTVTLHSLDYIKVSSEVYSFDPEKPSIINFTSSLEYIKFLKSLVSSNEQILKTRLKGFSNPLNALEPLENALKDQLFQLIDFLLEGYHGLLGFYQTRSRFAEYDHLNQQYQVEQPLLIDILIQNNLLLNALNLCEKFQDFKTLVDIIMKHDQQDRIPDYTNQFGAVFCDALYAYFIKSKMIKQLFSLPKEHDEMLSNYLKIYPDLFWKHEIKVGHFSAATETLYKLSQIQVDFKKKSLLLSLCKLSHVCSIPNENKNEMMIDSEIQDENTESFTKLITSKRETCQLQQEIVKMLPKISTNHLDKAYIPIINHAMSALKQGISLDPHILIDFITLLTRDYYLASINARQIDDVSTNPTTLQSTLLRRAWINNEWNIQSMTDDQFQSFLSSTPLYQITGILDISDDECFFIKDLEYVRRTYPFLDRDQANQLYNAFIKENHMFEAVRHVLPFVREQCLRMKDRD